jgi:hypothetical protein
MTVASTIVEQDTSPGRYAIERVLGIVYVFYQMGAVLPEDQLCLRNVLVAPELTPYSPAL